MTEHGEPRDISNIEQETTPTLIGNSFTTKRSPHAWGRNQRPASERSILKKLRSQKQNQINKDRPSFQLPEEDLPHRTEDE